MDMPLTLALLAASLSIAVLCGWLGARPPNLNKGPRLIPYRAIMLLGATLSVFLLIHAASLAGLKP